MMEESIFKQYRRLGVFGLVYLIAKEITNMAAGVKQLQDQIDIVNANMTKLEKSVDDLVDRKDAQIVVLQTQVQTDAATIKQLQDQIAAGGTAPDLQPQVDALVTHNSDIVTTTTVSDNA